MALFITAYGELRSVIIKVQHNCTSDRRGYPKLEDVPIKHEYCLVFKKVPVLCSEKHKKLAAIQLLR